MLPPERCRENGISIHALRGEGDGMKKMRKKPNEIFLSTPSVGRATRKAPPCLVHTIISIHALRGEGDFRRTIFVWKRCISIHALRGEGDGRHLQAGRNRRYFYPRPPWGGRRCSRRKRRFCTDFYPRPPWGGRRITPPLSRAQGYFYPRPPWGGRPPAARTPHQQAGQISIHALRGEGDGIPISLNARCSISIHALRGEGDRRPPTPLNAHLAFLSTPSVGRATAGRCGVFCRF